MKHTFTRFLKCIINEADADCTVELVGAIACNNGWKVVFAGVMVWGLANSDRATGGVIAICGDDEGNADTTAGSVVDTVGNKRTLFEGKLEPEETDACLPFFVSLIAAVVCALDRAKTKKICFISKQPFSFFP